MTVSAARESAWTEVAPEAVHREALKTTDGLNSYVGHLNNDTTGDHMTQALAGYDKMEARAKNIAGPEIIAAAKRFQQRSTGSPSTITNIQEAKAFFNVK